MIARVPLKAIILSLGFFAQASTGSIAGVVVGEAGHPVPGARVTAALEDEVRSTITDASGAFRFESLRPGRYFVTAELVGFQTAGASLPVTAGVTRWQPVLHVPRDRDRRGELQSLIGQLVGPDARDCGQLWLGQTGEAVTPRALQTALDCVTEAVARQAPVWTLAQDWGTDSVIVKGLLAVSAGQLFEFQYDSGGCIGCRSHFRVEPCSEPFVATDTGRLPSFACPGRRSSVTGDPMALLPRLRPDVAPLFSQPPRGPAFLVECRNMSGAPVASSSSLWPLSDGAIRVDGRPIPGGARAWGGLDPDVRPGSLWAGVFELVQAPGRPGGWRSREPHIYSSVVLPLGPGRHTVAFRCGGVWSAEVVFHVAR